MTDIVSKKKRSEMMSGISSKDTVPEITVRRALHSAGYRFRLHHKGLPGKPDLVMQNINYRFSYMAVFGTGTPDANMLINQKREENFGKRNFIQILPVIKRI